MAVDRYPVAGKKLALIVGGAATEPVNYQLTTDAVRAEIGRCRLGAVTSFGGIDASLAPITLRKLIGSISDYCAYFGFAQAGEIFNDFASSHASAEHLQNIRYGCPCHFHADFPSPYLRINFNVRLVLHTSPPLALSLRQ
ncbi:hypothetical protein [Microbulbifer sp. CnH-101-E]|uniref:hypothetical protein n=1 Tax=unclassified Microbulbifer TaxID=2619833 RepID=UPI004039FBE4